MRGLGGLQIIKMGESSLCSCFDLLVMLAVVIESIRQEDHNKNPDAVADRAGEKDRQFTGRTFE